jgi:hypothetical protein|uniref:Uncharacterized protein n=1 Tax=Mus musculus TaxID=10090 RepID=Q8BN28_MOUSE|nr:unnamed protein product [Mus musculus]
MLFISSYLFRNYYKHLQKTKILQVKDNNNKMSVSDLWTALFVLGICLTKGSERTLVDIFVVKQSAMFHCQCRHQIMFSCELYFQGCGYVLIFNITSDLLFAISAKISVYCL